MQLLLTYWTLVQSLQNVSINRRRHLIRIIAGISATFVLTVMCYWPSLSGPFLFDDIPNLELLGDRGGLTTADHYAEFIMSAQAGPLGRPLSLASFTLDGQTWPTDPHPFRITNLIIHVINGLLVFLLARLIFSTVHQRETAEKLALLCMTLWLLHPLLVSTTAYIVQRMTQLSGLFTLAGLLCYMHGRTSLSASPRLGWAWVIPGMGVCGAFALLCKETGILLPFYALVLELTVFSSSGLARRQRTALFVVLCIPIVLLLGYMTLNWGSTLTGFELRPFTIGERLLTQAVVLMDYLRQVFAPRLSGLGIFHDDFRISRGLLDPIVTLASFLTIATMIFLAAWFRKAWPFISLGILWFFVGHSLEAGPIPLELYFEHRNYLPLLGPLLAICSLLPLLSKKLRRALPLLLVLFIGMESFLTWQSAAPWGNEERLMRTALIEHPDSLRAQQYVANQYILHGNFGAALAAQEGLAKKFPEHAATRLSILNLSCILNVLTEEKVESTRILLEHSGYDLQVIGFFGPLVSNAAANTCDALGFAELHATLDALLDNPALAQSSSIRGAAHYHKGLAYKIAGDLRLALEQMDLSYATKPEIDIRLQQVVWLLESGSTDEAEHYLLLARQHGENRFWSTHFRNTELNALQQVIDQARDPGQ